MSKPYIILITGFPGTGKTYLSKVLSSYLRACVFSKDTFKEIVFDTLESGDQTWSRKVSGTAHRIMDYIVEEELRAGHGIILESNFKRDIDSIRFGDIQKKYDCTFVQVLCWAKGDVLAERFIARQRSTERHAGHALDISDEQIREDMAPGRCEPMDLDAPLLEVDTTHFEEVDYEAIRQEIASLLKSPLHRRNHQ